jgi:hypothetical protein
MDAIDEISIIIKWLDSSSKSTNIVAISQALNKLSILSSNISQETSEAYGLMNELEDVYEDTFNSHYSELQKAGQSAASSKQEAERLSVSSKKDYTTAKNGYKKLSMYLERVDRISDTFKQYVSNLKIDLKHS